MNIGLDLDGVLIDMIGPFCELIREQTGVTVERNSLTHYSLASCVPPEAMPYATKILRGPEIYRRSAPFDDAVGAIKRLTEIANVFIITSRPANLTELTGEHVNLHFPSVSGIVFDRHKGVAAKRLRCRAFLDDYPKNVEDISKARIRSCLLDRSYNQAPLRGDSRFLMRVHSISDFIKEVERLKSKGGI